MVIVKCPRLPLRSKTPSPFSGISCPAAETLPFMAIARRCPAFWVFVAAWATGSTALLTSSSGAAAAAERGSSAHMSRIRQQSAHVPKSTPATLAGHLDVRPGPTRSERRPASSSSSSAPTTSRRQPCSVRTSGSSSLGVAHRGDDPLQVGARGDAARRRAPPSRRARARAPRRARSAARRAASGWVGRSPSTGIGVALAATLDRLEDRAPAAAQRASLRPADLARRSSDCGRRLATSTSAASASTLGTGRSRARAPSPRATRRARRRPRAARARASSRAAGAGRRSRGSRSSEASSSERHSSSAQSRRPQVAQAVLQRVGELEQVQDVLARVADLLGAQRARVPAREARALAQRARRPSRAAAPRSRAGRAGRRSRPRPACRRRCGSRCDHSAAQQRDVLAAGVQDDLDRRGRRARRPAARGRTSSVERVEHLDADAVVGRRPRPGPGTAAAR